jgi:hypothetical protein
MQHVIVAISLLGWAINYPAGGPPFMVEIEKHHIPE